MTAAKYIYERESEIVVDMLGDIGGFNDIVTILLSMMLSRYSSIMFEGRLVKGTKVDDESEKRRRNNSQNGFLRVVQ